jgi:hypothetical protein
MCKLWLSKTRIQTNYLKRYCGQTLEVNEDVADRNQDGLTGEEEDARKLGYGNWRVDAQVRGRW